MAAAGLLGVVLGAALAGCRARPSAVITFVDHACFLLTGAEGTVLIDPGRGLSAAMVQRLTNGHPPFADLDLILVTHTHSDHFDPRLIDLLLLQHEDAVFASTQAAVVAMGGQNPDWVGSDRLQVVEPATDGLLSLSLSGVAVEALDLPHDRPVVNLGYIITLSGRRVLHSGDVAHPDHLAAHDLRAQDSTSPSSPTLYFFPRAMPQACSALCTTRWTWSKPPWCRCTSRRTAASTRVFREY